MKDHKDANIWPTRLICPRFIQPSGQFGQQHQQQQQQ